MNSANTILSEYKIFYTLKKKSIILNFVKNMNNYSRKITSYFDMMKTQPSEDIENKIINLEKLYKEEKSKYKNECSKHMPFVYSNYPELFELIVDEDKGINYNDLKNAINVFIKFNDGKISEHDAIREGLKHSTKEYKLPDNFYNTSDKSIDEYINNLKK